VLNVAETRLRLLAMHVANADGQYTLARLGGLLEGPRLDVAFVGSSPVLNGFDPSFVERQVAEETGARIRAGNLAVTGIYADVVYLVLKNVIPQQKVPRVIVYGLREIELVAGVSNRGTIPYVPTALRLDDFSRYARETATERLDFVLGGMVPLYRDQQLLRNALSIVFDPGDPFYRRYRKGGSAPEFQAWNPIPPGWKAPDPNVSRAVYGRVLRWPHFDSPLIERFAESLRVARARGSDVVVVNMPVSTVHRGYWTTPGDLRSYRQLVQRIAAEEGASLLDLYDPEGLIPEEAFYDTNHLTKAGAEILMRELVRRELAKRFPQAS
jgi:hypothetical protein